MALLSRSKVKEGSKAPDFTLANHDGVGVNLYEMLENGPVVLFFYPKNNTAVCTAEACAFRDAYEIFAEAGAQVVGISRDSVNSHGRFRARHDLPYTLLSDDDAKVHNLFGVRGSGPAGKVPVVGWAANDRLTFVIDRDGTVKLVHAGLLQAQGHVDEALAVVQELV